jgi:hypothetical protein
VHPQLQAIAARHLSRRWTLAIELSPTDPNSDPPLILIALANPQPPQLAASAPADHPTIHPGRGPRLIIPDPTPLIINYLPSHRLFHPLYITRASHPLDPTCAALLALKTTFDPGPMVSSHRLRTYIHRSWWSNRGFSRFKNLTPRSAVRQAWPVSAGEAFTPSLVPRCLRHNHRTWREGPLLASWTFREQSVRLLIPGPIFRDTDRLKDRTLLPYLLRATRRIPRSPCTLLLTSIWTLSAR